MGLHSVTCHLTQANTPHINPSQTSRTCQDVANKSTTSWQQVVVMEENVV